MKKSEDETIPVGNESTLPDPTKPVENESTLYSANQVMLVCCLTY